MLSDQVCGDRLTDTLLPYLSASYVLYSVSLLLFCSVWEAAGVFFTCGYNSIRYIARSVPAQHLSACWLCALEGLSALVIDLLENSVFHRATWLPTLLHNSILCFSSICLMLVCCTGPKNTCQCVLTETCATLGLINEQLMLGPVCVPPKGCLGSPALTFHILKHSVSLNTVLNWY